jgi:hypothetical protein
MDELPKVQSLLDAARRKLQDAERQVISLRAEIAAYEKVSLIMTGQDGKSPSRGRARDIGGNSARRSRGMSEVWRRVFVWIGQQTTLPETEDVWTYTQRENLDVNRNTLRSQLSVYTQQGLLDRIDGKYQLSEQGRHMLMGDQESAMYGTEDTIDDKRTITPAVPSESESSKG